MKKNVLLITACAALLLCSASRAKYRGGCNPSFVQEGIGYFILSEEEHTVAVCGTNDSELTSVRITEMVNNEGVDYNVTSIADSAFYGHQSLQQIELPQTFSSIGNAAFGSCPSLKEIVFGQVDEISYNVFDGKTDARKRRCQQWM